MQPFKYQPNLSSGQFRHYITFQKSVVVKDDLNQESLEWDDFKSAMAMIKTVKGREYFEAAQTQSETIVRFVIRYLPGIEGDMRIVYDGKTYDIVAPPINDDELNKTITLITKVR
ncbi:MAG: phage head closure protein [Bacillota bacterium]